MPPPDPRIVPPAGEQAVREAPKPGSRSLGLRAAAHRLRHVRLLRHTVCLTACRAHRSPRAASDPRDDRLRSPPSHDGRTEDEGRTSRGGEFRLPRTDGVCDETRTQSAAEAVDLTGRRPSRTVSTMRPGRLSGRSASGRITGADEHGADEHVVGQVQVDVRPDLAVLLSAAQHLQGHDAPGLYDARVVRRPDPGGRTSSGRTRCAGSPRSGWTSPRRRRDSSSSRRGRRARRCRGVRGRGFGGAYDVDEQFLLAAPAAVDGGLADPGRARDPLDGQLGEGHALLQELHHAFQDGAFHGFAARAAPGGSVRAWPALGKAHSFRPFTALRELSRSRLLPPVASRPVTRAVSPRPRPAPPPRCPAERPAACPAGTGRSPRPPISATPVPHRAVTHGVQEGVVGGGDQGLARGPSFSATPRAGLDGLAGGVAQARRQQTELVLDAVAVGAGQHRAEEAARPEGAADLAEGVAERGRGSRPSRGAGPA